MDTLAQEEKEREERDMKKRRRIPIEWIETYDIIDERVRDGGRKKEEREGRGHTG